MVEETKIDKAVEEQNTITSPLDLLHKLAIAEEEFRLEESAYTKEYNKLLLGTNWKELDQQRVEKGLGKLSNQDLKKAYIEQTLTQYKDDMISSKLKYNRLLRMYEMMKKYSLDVLR